MPAANLQRLADDIATDRFVSADEALRIRQDVFPDGVVSRAEAEVLIDLERRVANSDDAWAAAYVEAISDYVLQGDKFPGYVEEAGVVWLQTQFGEGTPRENQVVVLLKTIERAQSAPPALYDFVRERLQALFVGNAINAADVDLMRRCLFAGDGAVTEDEARWLFAIDAESAARKNDLAWTDLFVKAQLNYLMGRQPSTLLDNDAMRARQAWLLDKKAGLDFGAMFKNGWKGFFDNSADLSNTAKLEAYYEAANANAEEDAQLTPFERAWAVGMTQDDGKLTPNEKVLLAELEKIAP